MHADRRNVLKMIAAAPFLGMFGRAAQAAETGTAQTATASGRQILWRTFEGPFTSQIAFPLGGIGTGTVSLGGRGNLTDWEIANAPAKGRQLANTFFALWYGTPEGSRAYLLESKIPPPYLGWGGLAREGMPGMPRFARGRFLGAYPFARLELSDPDVPLEVTLEAFNPFIPLNDKDSGLPLAIFYWRIKNTGARTLPLTLLFSLQNMAGNRQLGQNLNRFQDDGSIRGLHMTTRKHRASSPHYGELALTTSHPEVTYQTRWARGAWFDDQSLFWKDFAEDGILERRFEEGPSGPEDTDTGCLGLRDQLDAGATKVFPFVLAWYFPNRANTWNSELQWTELRSDRVAGKVLRNFYATLFDDAWSVARYTAENLERLERETGDFHQALFSSTLPDFVLDAVSSQSSIMRTETVFRTADGRLWGFEGTKDDLGCCPLNCTHVWNYEQALAFLFPALERTMREVDFTHNTLPEGNMAFRTLLPLGNYYWRRELAAADGQMGSLVKLYREWKLSGDDQFLRRLWPDAKRALEYAWKRWDADRDGVMEGVQHNTYDIEFVGPNTMMGTIYLAALSAGEEMARALGDEGSAKLYREVYESGRQKLEQACWKGEYYVQVYEKAKETKYQLGDGCLSDQLLGQWMAQVCGLGYVLPPENVPKALAAVFAHNWKPRLSQHKTHSGSSLWATKPGSFSVAGRGGIVPTCPSFIRTRSGPGSSIRSQRTSSMKGWSTRDSKWSRRSANVTTAREGIPGTRSNAGITTPAPWRAGRCSWRFRAFTTTAPPAAWPLRLSSGRRTSPASGPAVPAGERTNSASTPGVLPPSFRCFMEISRSPASASRAPRAQMRPPGRLKRGSMTALSPPKAPRRAVRSRCGSRQRQGFPAVVGLPSPCRESAQTFTRSPIDRITSRASRTMARTTSAAPGKSSIKPTLCPDMSGK